MQLSLDLSQIGHTIGTNLPKFQATESNAFTPIPGCVLEHIILTSKLSDLEKLFYLLANSLSLINLNGGRQRATALSAESWAERLNCAKSLIFAMQKSLEDKGYFIISKDKNKHGQNKRNLICPTLPEDVFKHLSETSDNRVGEGEILYSPTFESKMQYLDRTKLFIILGYQVLKDIAVCKYLTPFHKLVWLDFYVTCYKARLANLGSLLSIGESVEFSFITSYGQLQDKYSCSKSVLSKILIDLEELGLIKREHFYTRKELGDQERQDRSLWKISLVSAAHIPSGSTPNNPEPVNGSGSRFGNFSSFNSSVNVSMAANSVSGTNGYNNADKFKKEALAIDSIKTKHDQLVASGEGNEDESQYIDLVTSELFEVDELYANQLFEDYNDNNKHGPQGSDGENGSLSEKPEKSPSFGSPIPFGELADISYDDPEILLPSLYDNKDNIINIYKSNLVNVYNLNIHYDNSNRLIERVKTNNNKKTTEYLKPIKNGWQNDVYWSGSAKTENKGVFKGVKFLKRKIHELSKFNVCTSLIKEKLKLLSKDKADKARKFAYSLFSKNLAKGYSSSLSKHELAKQFIFHATTWKPTKIGAGASEEQQIDIALSVAWNAVITGEWQEPLEWAKAKALQFEFLDHKRKYRESGIVSNEIRSLELIINNFLGANYDLTTIITKEAKELKVESVIIKENGITEEGSTIKERKEIDVRILDGVKAISNMVYDVESSFISKNYFNIEFFVKQNELSGNTAECQSTNNRSRHPLELKASLPSITLSNPDDNSRSSDTNIKSRIAEKYNHRLQLTLHNVSDDLLVKHNKHISKDFMKIDQALIEILKNLKKVN